MKAPKLRVRPLQFLAYALLTIYSILVALPLVWMVLSSTKTMRELFTFPFALPADPQWSNFAKAWQSGISQYLVNSLIVTSVSVTLIVLFSALAAYALSAAQLPRARADLFAADRRLCHPSTYGACAAIP